MQIRIALLALLSGTAMPAAGQVPTAAAAMRVDPATQRQRDQSRIVILQDELVTEALAVARARSESTSDPSAGQETARRISHHRQNISALARELALADRQTAVQAKAQPSAPNAQRVAAEWLLPEGAGPKQPSARRGSAPDWFIPASPTVTQ